jgi:hypothetical protein
MPLFSSREDKWPTLLLPCAPCTAGIVPCFDDFDIPQKQKRSTNRKIGFYEIETLKLTKWMSWQLP